jgi:hypothetical protein
MKNKYYFYCGKCNYRKHYVNFGEATQGTSHWVNSDLPHIYNEDENTVVEVSFPEYTISIYEDDLYKNIIKFIDKSDKAFHRKFKDKEWAGEYTGHLLNKII